MKIPFEFASKLIFRLIFPGLILAGSLAPAVSALAQLTGLSAGSIEILSFGVVFWGWLIILADVPIYMLYEGRRFWPRWLRSWGLSQERKRLKRLNRNRESDIRLRDQRLYQESLDELQYFPIGPDGDFEVRCPTRLGNIMTAYETYPLVKYGVDSTFWWYRLWVVLDKDLRDEVEIQQALADSPVYVSFALGLSALMFFGYSIASTLFSIPIPYISPPAILAALGATCAFLSFLLYRVALFAHRQYGETFKSLFDQHRSKLVLDDLIAKLGEIGGDLGATKRPDRDKFGMAAYYLRWHRIRPLGEPRNYSPEAWRLEKDRRQKLSRIA